MLVTRACDKVTVASQVHFLFYDSAALIFAQESKALHTDLEERSKAEAASEKSYTQKCKDLKWTLFVLFHIFFRGLSNFQSLVWQACALEDKLKQIEEAPLQGFTASE